MEKLKSSLTNMLVVLTVIAIVAAGVLASVNAVTAPQIEKINAENLAAGIKAVMGADDIKVADPKEIEGGFTAYAVSDASGAELGTAVTSIANGFGGPLKVLVGFDKEGTILGYTILEHAETPGLGAKAADWFQKGQKGNIIGLNPGTCNFTVSKDGGDVDAITASTITSRAFLLAIQNAYNTAVKGTEAESGATKQTDGECGKCPKAEGECCKSEGKCPKAEGECPMAKDKCDKCAESEGKCNKCPKADSKCDKCPKADSKCDKCPKAEADCCKNK